MRDNKEIFRMFLRACGYLALVAVAVALVVAGALVFSGEDDDGTQGSPEVKDEVVEDIPVQREEVDVPSQEDTVSSYQVILTSYSDIGSQSYLNGTLFGSGSEATFVVTKSSVLLNISADGGLSSMPPSEIPLGSLVTIYTFDEAGHGHMEVAALLIGENTSGYSLGKFKEVKEVVLTGVDGERTVTVWGLSSSLDLVCVTDAVIRSGFSGAEFSSLNSPNKGDYFLYIRKPDFDIMEDGNLYYAETVIVLGLNS